jgi:hypothetical protein
MSETQFPKTIQTVCCGLIKSIKSGGRAGKGDSLFGRPQSPEALVWTTIHFLVAAQVRLPQKKPFCNSKSAASANLSSRPNRWFCSAFTLRHGRINQDG